MDRQRWQGASMATIIYDILGAIVLGLYALLLGPLGVLRGPLALERTLWYGAILASQGLLMQSIRAALDWRLGNFEAAIAQLETIVARNEDYYKARVTSPYRKRVLEDLYVVLTRAYLHSGGIDEAMLVVIRAKKCMGIERLPGLAKIDAKTAHLVRAGLAAGRLLEGGGGLTTMFVKSGPQESKPAATPSQPPIRRQGAQAAEPPVKSERAKASAKIIPFPTQEK